jgi:hypothetical protein
MRARPFSASFEPLTPPQRNARRDTGFPRWGEPAGDNAGLIYL